MISPFLAWNDTIYKPPTRVSENQIYITAISIIIILYFTFIGGLNSIDSGDYTTQIQNYRHFGTDMLTEAAHLKSFQSLYPTFGLVLQFLSPDDVILALNVFFFCGLWLLVYKFFQELGFSTKYSLYGAIASQLSYPALLYGYAIGTDVSGWFFCLATIVTFQIAFRTKNTRLFILASLLGFLGFLCKETGILGLGFSGVYILTQWKQAGMKNTLRYLAFLVLPFLAIECIYLGILLYSGAGTFPQWFASATSRFASVHTLKFWIGSEISTFHIYLLYAFIGVYAIIRKKISISKQTSGQLIALFITALPVLAWPIFLSRILFIQFIAIMPLALFGLQSLSAKYSYKTSTRFILFLLPVVMSFVIMNIGGQDGLYELRHMLDRRIK